MKYYKTLVFKGHHVLKSKLKDGSPYKQRTFLMITEDMNDIVISTIRIVQSENQPDPWHTFLRKFKNVNYWVLMTGMKLEHYMNVDGFISDKIIELSEKITKK